MSDEQEEGSRAAGGCLLTGASLGVGMAIFIYSRDVFVLVVWAVSAVLLWRAARKVHSTPDSTPPAPPERGPEEEPQFSIVHDPTHPNRWAVNQKETGTS